MPTIKSAIKRDRKAKKANAQNSSYKSAMRTAIKRFDQAVEAGADNTNDLFKNATKLVDKAVSKNLIHQNKAAREKSRMAKKLNA
ncbi:MAG: 30S ribosomal protein S20 [Aerococcus sp.]|nr:30S ribosomal protein S20 [Aerococcus sp.]